MEKLKKIFIKIPFMVIAYMAIKKLKALPWYILDLVEFKKFSRQDRFSVNFRDIFPCLIDKTNLTKFEPHYIYHPAWAARVVRKIDPDFHVDISSSLHFCTIVSAFIPVKYYDYRPAKLNLDNLSSGSADLNALPFDSNSIKSLSCMHVVEHIGLGRYGDPLDPEGDLKAINELKRVLAPGGNLILVVPVGKPKIQFNAHRIYSYEQIIGCFKEFELKEFSLVPDDYLTCGLINHADPDLVKEQNWGCGCFWFVKG